MKRLKFLVAAVSLAALMLTAAGRAVFTVPTAAAAGLPQPAKTWYFAEGHTSASMTTYLTLANPNPAAAHVSVRYLLRTPSPPITASYTVAAFTRATIDVNSVIGLNRDVSFVVTSADQSIVAERPMYFTYSGLRSGVVPGGSDVLGATSLGTTFSFAYLDSSPGHDTWLTVLNPNASTMNVTGRYLASDGTATTTTTSVPANSRGTIFVDTQGPPSPGTYSAVVTLSAPGLVERPLYMTDSVTGYTGSATLVGVPAARTDWYFAEGYVAATASERYVLANPDPSTPATATLTLYRPAPAPSVSTTVTLPPGSQRILSANALLPAGSGDNSAAVHTSSGTLLAERVMSIKYQGPVGSSSSSSIPSATDVAGTNAPGTWFYFAEGHTAGTFAEYLTIVNPDASRTAAVLVSFLPTLGNGAASVRVYYVLPGTRFTLYTGNVMPGQSFSMLVQSDVPIVAERPMYFVYAATQTGAHDVLGYQPPETASAPPLTSCTPAPGAASVSSSVIYTGNTSGRQVTLTIDSDGGDPGNATAYLNILKNQHVHATFFLTGQFAQANPTVVQRIRDEGHDIGNHTYDHPSLPTLTDSGICQELNQADQVISGVDGRTVRPYLRPPYGDIGTDRSGHTVQAVAAGLGYRTIWWSIDPRDWDPATTTQQIIDRILNSPSLKPGAIILMHVNSNNEKYALDTVITGLKQRGFSVVPLSQLLG